MRRAFCIVLVLVTAAPAWAATPEFDSYTEAELAVGARTVPVAARVAYRDAVTALRNHDTNAATTLLHRAIELDPVYADAYFTLARVELQRFRLDGIVAAAQGVRATLRSFPSQSLLALNVVAMLPYVLFVICLVACTAYAIRYLPFVAHRLRAFLDANLRAALPGFTAYLVLLVPVVIVPGVITTLAYLTVICWMFMRRRERFSLVLLIAPIVVLGWFGGLLQPLTPAADPTSLTTLISRATTHGASGHVIRDLDAKSIPALEAERQLALGLAYQKAGFYGTAADHYYRSVSANPEDPAGYINLGNVYFLEEKYDKAIEGYRKAESIRSDDPVCKYDLAQAYIKTLLMKEASQALVEATALGIDDVKATYATAALEQTPVLPSVFSASRMWRIAAMEGQVTEHSVIDEIVMPFTRFPMRTSAWILVIALAAAIVLSRAIHPSRLTFQCSNCGRLTCEECCASERDMDLCQDCADTIKEITSDKVIDALLRQKRQAALVARRKSARLVNVLLPGLRDIAWGRIGRGFLLAGMFGFACVQLVTRGYILKDSMQVVFESSTWKMILPAAGIVITYLISWFSKPSFDYKVNRKRGANRVKESRSEPVARSRVA